MKILIEKHALVAALAHVAPIAASKGTIAILANVLLTAANGKLTLRMTNLDMEIVTSAACAIEREGETTVNVARLFDIARNMQPGAQILFDLGDDPRMKVSAGRSRFMLPVVTPSDFPVIEAQKYETTFALSATQIATVISQVGWAQSVEATQYYLCGIHMLAIDGKLRFEASNGLTVAISDLSDVDGADGVNAIIPSATVAAIGRLVDPSLEQVSISLSQSRMSVMVDGVTLSSKLIDGGFPDIARVIPKTLPNTMNVDADALSDAVKRVAGVSDDKIPAIALAFSPGLIGISTRGNDGEEGYDEIECIYDGPEFKAKFTTDYVISAIAGLNADVLEIQFGDERTGQIWRSSLNADVMALLMPRVA